MRPKWFVYLKDGRIGLGIKKYRWKNKTYYLVTGYGFSIGDLRPDKIEKLIKC